jgi:hypothetical protein
MNNTTMIALFLATAGLIGGFAFAYWRHRRSEMGDTATDWVSVSIADAGKTLIRPRGVPYRTEATEALALDCFKLAFDVSHIDYEIFGVHARVLEQVEMALGDAPQQQQYFPRRPLLLPKLIHALNDTEATRHELVRLILEDPTLAGTALKRANNVFYRTSATPVESLDRAVLVLGTDGLRSLLSAALLQPVFRLPKGLFDSFGEIAWEQAQRSAASAQAYAEREGSEDPFVAQVLGVLRSVATLVLFRLTLDKYRGFPNTTPRAEVFIRALQVHGPRLAVEIGKSWSLSDASIAALEEQALEVSPSQMCPLGRAIYFGELAGSVSTANHHIGYAEADGQAILQQQGLSAEVAKELLTAARGTDLIA